jgi:hypothetical protein
MGTIDEILARIRRLPVSERLRLIAQATREVAEDTPVHPAVGDVEVQAQQLSVDEFLSARLTPPLGVLSVTLQDMERAIAEGMSGRGGV